MNEQNRPDIISLEIAASEFSSAYGPIIGKLVVDKLTLMAENMRLKTEVEQLKHELELKLSKTSDG